MTRTLFNRAAASPTLQPLHIDIVSVQSQVVYVDSGMIAAYRRHLLPLAHGLTPNGFELERLIGQPTGDIGGVIAAVQACYQVVIALQHTRRICCAELLPPVEHASCSG